MRKTLASILTLLLAAVIITICIAECTNAPRSIPTLLPQESSQPVYAVDSTETEPGVTLDGAPHAVPYDNTTASSSYESFTIAWLSDPQDYSDSVPEIFESMTGWIAANAEKEHIVYTIGTGDFVNSYDAPRQWENADNALRLLGDVPLFAVAGNHDINGNSQNYTAYLQCLGEERFKGLSTAGGFYEGGKGRYDLLDVGGVSLLLVGLGYGMDESAIAWMNGVLEAYPERIAILCVHGYIDPDGSFTSDGSKLYQAVVVTHPNVKLVLCGHRHGVNHTVEMLDDNEDGRGERTVYAMVADYQDEAQYGSGYFCLLTFDPQQEELRVRTYSPYLDDFNCYADESGLEEYVLPFTFHKQ